MIPIEFVSDQCEDCGCTFQRAKYDEGTHRCKSCEHVYTLRRIADALEYWVGHL